MTDARRFEDGSYYPGKWTHYGIYTQNHVIDVIAWREPMIVELGNVVDGQEGPEDQHGATDTQKASR